MSTTGSWQHRQKVLVVDDNRNIRRVLGFMLEEDYDVVVAGNGLEALRVAWEHKPDVIVLDHEMPLMNGEESAHFLRIVSPDSWILGFSAATSVPLGWADRFLPKERIADLPGLLQARTASPAVA